MGRTTHPEILRAQEVVDASDIEKLANWLDTRFRIPGLGWRFGFDSIIGLVPGIGDGLTALLSCYIIARAHQLGASPWLMARMGWNVLFDSLLGAIPILGDLFDLANKSNTRNIRLLLRDLERRGLRTAQPINITPRESR
jgi:hypothetical protein